MSLSNSILLLSPDGGGGFPSPMETSTSDEFTARFLFSGRVKLKRETLGSGEEEEEETEYLIGGERWLERSVGGGGGERRSDEKVEEAAMLEEEEEEL